MMKNITFVSAGAGSGKTYTLTQEIARAIEEGTCRAEEIILTTYTEAAAKELREKVRSTLYSKGLYEAAMNIDNAAIGTIHSIAYKLVHRYWYLLGISANVAILDDDNSKFYISQSVSALPSEVNLELFDYMLKAFNIQKYNGKIYESYPLFWKAELVDLIAKTVEFNIDDEQLRNSCEESKKLLNEVIGFCDHYDISDDKIRQFKKIAQDIFNDQSLPKSNKDSIEPKMQGVKTYNGTANEVKPLVAILDLASLIAKIKNRDIKTKYEDGLKFIEELAGQILHSVQVKNLVNSYIDTLFDLALKWKEEYAKFKQERCLLDFNDILQKFDELLGKDEVAKEIKSRYKVAFVDEFQDCSPLQVKSFERLSELMKHSFWVGDIKQAIYGFRGSNTTLIQSIIDDINQNNNGNELRPLKHSWRSNQTIVDLVNSVFCDLFYAKGGNEKLTEDLIKLSLPIRTKNDPPEPNERELQHMHFVCGNKDKAKETLAQQVNELLLTTSFKPNEVAILYYSNDEVYKCAKELQKLGIPYNVALDKNKASDDSQSNDISSFINAVVTFAVRKDNELSKALIVNRIEQGYNASKILSDKIRHYESKEENKPGWLSELGIIERFERLRETIRSQSVSAAIETLVVELNLNDLIQHIDPTAPTYNYCSALISRATAYEKACNDLGRSSTLVGFAENLKEKPIEYPGDDNGVTVTTYHKSKGLEWPCVILCSLERKAIDFEKVFFGPLVLNSKEGSKLRLCPQALKRWKDVIDVEKSEFFKGIRQAKINEEKRLLYVGMTRPKEQLILATFGKEGKNSKDNGDNLLTEIGCSSIDSHNTEERINWGGYDWKHERCEHKELEEEEVVEPKDIEVLKQPAEPSSYNDKFISPSKVEFEKPLYTVEQCGEFANRISMTAKDVAADKRDSTIGDFIHHLMCLWSGDKSIIEPMAKAYGVEVDIDAVATSIEGFWSWMKMHYGEAKEIKRELPFSFANNGQVVSGRIDLVYCTAEGDVLVDYKTYQGKVDNIIDASSDFYAGKKYAGEFSLYEEALRRSGSAICDRLICYFTLGIMVKMR